MRRWLYRVIDVEPMKKWAMAQVNAIVAQSPGAAVSSQTANAIAAIWMPATKVMIGPSRENPWSKRAGGRTGV